MAKLFAPRKSKKDRSFIKITNVEEKKILELSDKKLLDGAKLSDVKLKDIVVKEQVRTKFNDKSLMELGENIKSNGLIQPLVIHREGSKFILICGERRYRAMKLIKMEQAPCYILEGKAPEELMAIQFSENSSREELHYIDKAEGIYNYQKATGASERKIQNDLGISKSEVHRALLISKLSKKMKQAAKAHNIEKYVLLEFDILEKNHPLKKQLEADIIKGNLTKRSTFRKKIRDYSNKNKKDTKDNPLVGDFIKEISKQTKDLKLDRKTRDLVNKLVQESSDKIKM